MQTDPNDDDFRWLGYTDDQVRLLRWHSPEVRRVVYELALEELMHG